RSQLADGARGQVTGHLAGLLDAVQRRIGCFPSCLVFARGFSERGRGLFDIEYVVHNLEGPADVFAKSTQPFDVRFARTARERSGRHGRANQRRGLRAVNMLEHLGLYLAALRLEVRDLPSYHATARSGSYSIFVAHGPSPRGRDGRPSQRLEGQRQQGVPRQDRGGLAELLVASGLAAPQVVVIERG